MYNQKDRERIYIYSYKYISMGTIKKKCSLLKMW